MRKKDCSENGYKMEVSRKFAIGPDGNVLGAIQNRISYDYRERDNELYKSFQKDNKRV